MTLPKKILFYGLLLLLTLAAVEGMARIAYYLAYAEGYSIPPMPDAAADPDAGEYQEPLTRGEYGRIVHPYYGHTQNSRRVAHNAMPPRQTAADTVLIALVGGSVAYDLTYHFRQAVEQFFDQQGLSETPVVIPLADGAIKQPQQLGIISYMLTMGGGFDLIVNLDGHNELSYAYGNFQQGVFPFYPTKWHTLNSWTIEEVAFLGRIQSLRAELTELQAAGTSNPFRYSAAFGLINRYRSQSLENRILQLNYALSTAESAGYSLERYGPLVNFANVSEFHHEAVRVWYRSSALLSLLADRTGADYYHFLQPNQYVPESKPLSPEELRHSYNPTIGESANYPYTYPLLVRYGQELQRQGVNYFDLTRIFAGHAETLYIDECCHLNRRGNELLAAALVQRLAPALLRHGRSAAPAAGSILSLAAPPPVEPPPPATPASHRRRPAARAQAQWQVSLRPGNALEYARDNCFPEHTRSGFFLHITPVAPADLPPRRQEHGFANRDFTFLENGGLRVHRHCAIERQLPNYPIARIRTGQFNAAGEIWAVELSFPE